MRVSGLNEAARHPSSPVLALLNLLVSTGTEELNARPKGMKLKGITGGKDVCWLFRKLSCYFRDIIRKDVSHSAGIIISLLGKAFYLKTGKIANFCGLYFLDKSETSKMMT